MSGKNISDREIAGLAERLRDTAAGCDDMCEHDLRDMCLEAAAALETQATEIERCASDMNVYRAAADKSASAIAAMRLNLSGLGALLRGYEEYYRAKFPGADSREPHKAMAIQEAERARQWADRIDAVEATSPEMTTLPFTAEPAVAVDPHVIRCQLPGCRAEIVWVGHPADPVKFAESRGYRLFKGRWRCTVHARAWQGENSRSEVEGEGRQPGPATQDAPNPIPSPKDHLHDK